MRLPLVKQWPRRVILGAGMFCLFLFSAVVADNPPPRKKPTATTKPTTSRPAKWRRDNSAGVPWRTGHRPVKLWPFDEKDKNENPRSGEAIVLGDWSYRSERAPSAKDGVPWRLIVTPAGPDAFDWQRGGADRPMIAIQAARAEMGAERSEKDVPVIEIPESVWRQRMAKDLQDVVGIHFHEFVSDDVARILYTIHKVPPDKADGSPINGDYEGKPGTRIEATLMTPVIWHLDQSIVVRVDNEKTPSRDDREKQTDYRIQHELGHAGVSQDVITAVIAGPQTWNPKYCEGRRSEFEYYWKRSLIGRRWDGYRTGGGAKIATLRTSIAVVPPTRWSMLLPIPPHRVTQKHLQQFNNEIVLLGPALVAADKAAQEKFHSHQGEYDAPVGP